MTAAARLRVIFWLAVAVAAVILVAGIGPKPGNPRPVTPRPPAGPQQPPRPR